MKLERWIKYFSQRKNWFYPTAILLVWHLLEHTQNQNSPIDTNTLFPRLHAWQVPKTPAIGGCLLATLPGRFDPTSQAEISAPGS